eukprot:837226-Pelagomonas_calceolata.AAC.1
MLEKSLKLRSCKGVRGKKGNEHAARRLLECILERLPSKQGVKGGYIAAQRVWSVCRSTTETVSMQKHIGDSSHAAARREESACSRKMEQSVGSSTNNELAAAQRVRLGCSTNSRLAAAQNIQLVCSSTKCTYNVPRTNFDFEGPRMTGKPKKKVKAGLMDQLLLKGAEGSDACMVGRGSNAAQYTQSKLSSQRTSLLQRVGPLSHHNADPMFLMRTAKLGQLRF